MLALGPWLMGLFFGGDVRLRPRRPRARLGRHGPLPRGGHAQPGGARARARQARRPPAGSCSAAAFVVFLLLPGFDDRVLQVELGFVGAAPAACCCACSLAYALYRRAPRSMRRAVLSVSPRRETALPHLPASARPPAGSRSRPATAPRARPSAATREDVLQPRLHLPEGARAQGAARRPRPAAHAAPAHAATASFERG